MNDQVHILGPQYSSFARSVMLCCEEKGISYSHGFDIAGREIAFKSARHHQLHPFGKIPVLLHGERVLYETAVICRYLDAEFPGAALQPENLYDRALLEQWCAVISLYIDQAIVRNYLLEFAFPKGSNGEIRADKVTAALPDVIAMLQMLQTKLGNASFICGASYTLADALITPMLDYLARLPHGPQLLADHPALDAYLERMRRRASATRVLLPPDTQAG